MTDFVESTVRDSCAFLPHSLKMEPKTKGLKQQQQQHKRLLAAMLSQDSFDSAQSTAASVTEEDIDNEDDAMELLGNCNRLPVFSGRFFISGSSNTSVWPSTDQTETAACGSH